MRRRDLLIASGATLAVGAGRTADPFAAAALDADLRRYDGFGVHRTGSPTDVATSRWLGTHLRRHGFAVTQPAFDAELFLPELSVVHVAGRSLPVFPQEPFVTADFDLAAPLAALAESGTLAGRIAVTRLPYSRDASLGAAPYPALMADATARGAAALIAVTDGPTGELIVLNTLKDGSAPPLPVLLVAPRDAGSLVPGAPARIVVRGQRRTVTARNTVGIIERAAPTIVVSTPQSGWTHAAGERGPGIALWRALATWAGGPRRCRMVFVATSGHELAHAGLSQLLEARALPVGELALWLHLGANLATTDYVRGVSPLRLLGSANPDRGIGVSPARLAMARAAFADLPFAVQSADPTRAFGEARQILAAGFAPVAGVVGSSAFHHIARDRAGVATSGRLIEPLGRALLRLLDAVDTRTG